MPLNLNKKTGDTFSAAEVNAIGAAIDQNEKDIAELRSSMMYWYVDYNEGTATALSIGGNLEVRQDYFDQCGRIIVNREGFVRQVQLAPFDFDRNSSDLSYLLLPEFFKISFLRLRYNLLFQ